MTKDAMDERRSAIEDESTKEELRKVSGMTDDAVPLISVAWADGSIQDNEEAR